MPKILFVAAHRAERSPSQRFRFEQYFDFLKNKGWQVSFSFIITQWADKYLYQQGYLFQKLVIFINSLVKRIKDVFTSKNTDVVFVQREAFMTGTSFFEQKFASNCKLVFDFDDSIWFFDENPKQGLLNKLKNPSKTADIIGLSHLVIAGNQYLADYAKQYNDNVIIIPTTIDTDEYKPLDKPVSDALVCIGWSGSFSTIKHFEIAIPALLEIKKKYGDKVCFKVIGDGNYKHEELGIIGDPWQKQTELSDLCQIDIGLMPLPDDHWSKGKCGLKGLQYMALEIPTIMSPVGVNSDIIVNGENGFLADGINEWVEAISQLVDSHALRTELGVNGRKTVVEQFSVKSNQDRYLKAFESLLD